MIVAITDKNGLFGRFEKLPTAEAERWHAAFVETDGRRHVKSKQAGLNGVCWMTLNEFCDEVEGRIFRWLHGRYEVCEAAQILADANPGTVVIPGPDAEEMCKLMEAAIHAGDLTVRLNGVELPATSFTQYRLWKYTVFESDVKEWLKKNPCGYTFNYPYHTPDSDLQAAPVIPKNQRPDLLTPLIEKAQRGETDLFSAAVIWPKLCDMAERKTTPFIGKTESGLQWIDANDNPRFLTKDALSDRLRRQKNPR